MIADRSAIACWKSAVVLIAAVAAPTTPYAAARPARFLTSEPTVDVVLVAEPLKSSRSAVAPFTLRLSASMTKRA